MREGDDVLLEVPENPRLQHARATVEAVTPWGAHVLTEAAATGRFRALFSEMRSYALAGEVCDVCGSPDLLRAGSCLVCASCGTSTGC